MPGPKQVIENVATMAGLGKVATEPQDAITGGYDYTQKPEDPVNAPPPGAESTCPGYR
jgi:hypothetical protein